MMKRLFSLVMAFVLTLSLGAGLGVPTSASGLTEAEGSNSHSYSGPAYIYTEEAYFSGLTCVIPEFEIAQSGKITLNFGGASITGAYKASKHNYSSSTSESDNVSNGNLPDSGLGSIGTSVSQGSNTGSPSVGHSGYYWQIAIMALSSSVKTKAPSPYNNLGHLNILMMCEIRDTDTFPKTTLRVAGVGKLTTEEYPCTFNSQTVDYSLDCEFEDDYGLSSGSLEIKLEADSDAVGSINLTPKQQSTPTTSTMYYGSSGISVEALCSTSKLSGNTITVCCSKQLDVEEKPATCTNAGYKIKSCECGYYEKIEYNATGHSWYPDTVTAPTCTEKGSTLYKCKNCDDSWVGAYTAALGHNYSSKVTAPTCTQKGYTTYTCSVCGDSYKDNYKNVKDHSYALISETVATCEKDGVRTYACECGDAYTEHETALGHNYEGGLCSACGKEDPNADVEEEFTLGDVNGDGRINFSDYSKTLYCAKNPGTLDENSDEFKRMDINGDGRINFSDYAQVLALAKGV